MTEVRPGDPLADLAGTRQRTAAEVEPQVVAKTDGVDDERVALPAADRYPLPRGSRILRQRTTVEEDLPVVGVVLLECDEELRRLDELDDMRQAMRAQERIGQAQTVRVVLGARRHVLLDELRRPGLVRKAAGLAPM